MVTNWPTGAAINRQSRKRRKRPTSKAKRAERRTNLDKLQIVEREAFAARLFARVQAEASITDPESPDKGKIVGPREPGALCPAPRTVGGGQSVAHATLGRSGPVDGPTRFVSDGDNTARDARRQAIVHAMIKANR